MGLATIDPHSQKERAEIHKFPKFGVNWPLEHVWLKIIWLKSSQDKRSSEISRTE